MKAQLTFGKWLKQQRKLLDLTQSELARQVGCATITIQMLEADKRRPSKQMAEVLAIQLNIEEIERSEFIKFARLGTGEFHASTILPGFPPIGRDFSTHRIGNIPALLTPITGRDKELSSLRQRILIDGVRLLTLIGPPGVGKTRLALQIAFNLEGEFESGAYFISLATVRNEKQVAPAIAQSLGVNQIGTQTFVERLIAYLQDKHALLVLDNFEQVVSAAPLVSEMLAACPWLYILVTSRVQLSIRGERHFRVAPLSLPTEDAINNDMSELMRSSAIALFIERAQDINPEFALTEENRSAVIKICRQTDGLPLAIELIAARMGAEHPEMLLEQYSGRKILHADGLRDMPERHHSLYHAIDWSYALLSPAEQTLLASLSVFNGGFSQEAAQFLITDQHTSITLESLKILINHHLVVQTIDKESARYTLLETIRDFASERLDDLGKTALMQNRHAEYYLSLAEHADTLLRGPDQVAWLNKLEVERSNLRRAFAWLFTESRDFEKGLRLAAALMWFWNIRSHISEASEWFEMALQHGQNFRPDLRLKHLLGIGIIESQRGNLPAARNLLEEAIILARQLGPPYRWDLAVSLSGYANIVMYQIDQEVVERAAKESLEISEQIGDLWATGLAHAMVGEAHLLNKDFHSANHSFDAGNTCMRKTGDAWGTSVILLDWGYTNLLLGNLSLAQKQLEESIALLRSIGERYIRSTALNILATLVQQQGDFQRTTALYNESLDLLRKMGIETSIVTVQYNLAVFVQAHGYASMAEKLFKECLIMYTQQADMNGIEKCRAALESISTGGKSR